MVGQQFLSLVLMWIISSYRMGKNACKPTQQRLTPFQIRKKEEKISCTPEKRKLSRSTEIEKANY
jgi:hypothetical protein